jgi:hypothetical protein
MQDELTTAHEERKEREAEAAAERIKRGDHWLDWIAVGEGLVIGRLRAMRKAGTNQPIGAAYNRAFGDWMDQHKWARDLDRATRNHAMWAAENRNEIDRWRETLAQNVRARMNHPTTMKRQFEAAHRVPVDEPKQVESPIQKRDREIERLAAENQALRKRAEADGSLFDLKGDKVEDIARAIAGNISLHRLTSLQKAIAAEIARLKAEQKQAG